MSVPFFPVPRAYVLPKAVLTMTKSLSRFAATCIAIALFVGLAHAIDETITFSKASLKVHVKRDGEKVNLVMLSTQPDSLSQVASSDGFEIGLGHSISVQASFIDANSEATSIHQPFMRFVNQRTKQDNVYLLNRKGKEMRLDLGLKAEIKGDLDFWTKDDVYGVQLVMGDWRLERSATWVITERMRFAADADPMFEHAPRSVFDFDVGVKKEVLPEFETALSKGEKRAPLLAIVLALVGVLLPLPLLVVGWIRLGVFPLQLPRERGERLAFLGFEACIVGHLVALVMFWVRWNIVTTWKVMGMLMVPTLLFGRSVVSGGKR